MKDLPFPAAQLLTREGLANGALLQALRRNPPPGVCLRSDEELEQTLDEALSGHPPGEDLHVFGYGSLMWNPALHIAESRLALVQGWHRRFCIRTLMARGSVEKPGAMLALDRGGACVGLLLRISAPQVRDELRLLWRREMLAGSYDARWVSAQARGHRLRALSFVARVDHERYIGGWPDEAIAALIRSGEGVLGNTRSYFELTLQTLARLRIRDRGLERLRRAVQAADLGAPK
jgi:glutathione-specific gamma-glutamylcyclotransferase